MKALGQSDQIALLTSITTTHAVNQSTDFIEPFHKTANISELNDIPAKNDGLEETLTFEYQWNQRLNLPVYL